MCNWAKKTPEKKRAINNRWVERNREHVREYQRNWRLNNPVDKERANRLRREARAMRKQCRTEKSILNHTIWPISQQKKSVSCLEKQTERDES